MCANVHGGDSHLGGDGGGDDDPIVDQAAAIGFNFRFDDLFFHGHVTGQDDDGIVNVSGFQIAAGSNRGTKNTVCRGNIASDIDLGVANFEGPQASPLDPVSFLDGAGHFDMSIKRHMSGLQ